MMKWTALAVGAMMLGAVAAVMFVNVMAPQSRLERSRCQRRR